VLVASSIKLKDRDGYHGELPGFILATIAMTWSNANDNRTIPPYSTSQH
jgi:hypothetical protein